MTKSNIFPSLIGVADTRNCHFKYLFALSPSVDDMVLNRGSIYAR
jgi:hypothetical protein